MELFLFDDFFGINQAYVSKFFSEQLHEAVKSGNIDLVEELLEEPGADINSVYYGENLLWTAIMYNQFEIARFLVDNGINTKFKSCRIDIKPDENSTSKGVGTIKVKIERAVKDPLQQNDATEYAIAQIYPVTCRELAYERGLWDIVKLIDYKEGKMLKGSAAPAHVPRLTKANRDLLEAAQAPMKPPQPQFLSSRFRSKTGIDFSRGNSDGNWHIKETNRLYKYILSAKAHFDTETSSHILSPHARFIDNSKDFASSMKRSGTTLTDIPRQQSAFKLKHTEDVKSPKKLSISPGSNFKFERKLTKSAINTGLKQRHLDYQDNPNPNVIHTSQTSVHRKPRPITCNVSNLNRLKNESLLRKSARLPAQG